MRAALTTLWILSGLLLVAPVCAAAEIAPTTGKVDEKGNEVLEGEEAPSNAKETDKNAKARPPSRFAEKPKGVSLPEPGADLEDDGGADDVPLPTHPLLRQAVLNRQRRASGGAGTQSETTPEPDATISAASSAPAEEGSSRGWLIVLGLVISLGACLGWVYRLYSLGRPTFSKPGSSKPGSSKPGRTG